MSQEEPLVARSVSFQNTESCRWMLGIQMPQWCRDSARSPFLPVFGAWVASQPSLSSGGMLLEAHLFPGLWLGAPFWLVLSAAWKEGRKGKKPCAWLGQRQLHLSGEEGAGGGSPRASGAPKQAGRGKRAGAKSAGCTGTRSFCSRGWGVAST